MRESLKKNKGITLIALVITIIVLLILAGVTIISLSGDNGILTRATEGKEETNKSIFEEKLKLASTELKMGYETNKPIENPLNFLKEKFEEVIDNGDNSYTVKDNISESIIYITGETENRIKVQENVNNGIIKEIREGNIPIPVGYEYVKGNEKTGAVIKEEDGKAEFVWVPVNNPKTMYGIDSNAKKWGKSYKSTNIDEPENWTEDSVMKITDMQRIREPDIIDQDDDTNTYIDGINTIQFMNSILGEGTYKTAEDFKSKMEIDFNNMIASVEKYNGFYVGRYESSIVGNDNNAYLAPIKGAKSETGKTWYEFYARQKKYEKGQIKGSMIWNCQYDAMMRWMKNNGLDVTSAIPIPGAKRNQNSEYKTGVEEKDKLLNVYDLLGNYSEETLGVFSKFHRVGRGGERFRAKSPTDSFGVASQVRIRYTSRLTLYIPVV